MKIRRGHVHNYEFFKSCDKNPKLVVRFCHEKKLTKKMGTDKKYSFETRGASTVRVYSEEFSSAYHRLMRGMVERQMRKSVKMVGDLWYTCWVDAGQPDLNKLIGIELSEAELEIRKEQLKIWKEANVHGRMHEH